MGITKLPFPQNAQSITKDEKKIDTSSTEKFNAPTSPWNHIEEKAYGLGMIRTVDKFYETFGIDVASRNVQQNMCSFVGTPMNKLFIPHLRRNKMGIDYNKISFHFQDPSTHGKTWEKYVANV